MNCLKRSVSSEQSVILVYGCKVNYLLWVTL